MVIVLGWLLLIGSGVAACIMYDADRRLQAFRLPSEPRSAYWFVPVRIRRELYKPEAGHLVGRAWRAIGAMYGLAVAGAILLSIGYAGK